MIKLGDKVICKHTGFRGVVTQRVTYLGEREDCLCVQPDCKSGDGELPQPEYIAESWLKPDQKDNVGFVK